MQRSSRAACVTLLLAASTLSTSWAQTVETAPKASATLNDRVVKVEPLGRLFPFLDLYYRLGASRRTRFTLAYRLHHGGVAADARVTLLGREEVALPLSPGGWFERIPSEGDMAQRLKVRVDSPAGARFGVSLVPAVDLIPGTDIDPALVVAALDQFETEIHAAGPLGVLIPHFRHVQFDGGRGGVVVGAEGESSSPPIRGGEPFLTIAALRRAGRIHFETAPERVLILPD